MSDPMLGYLSIAIMAIAATFWGRALVRVEIPRNRSPFIVASIIAAALGITSLAGESGWLAGTLAGLSIFVAAFFLLTVAIGGQKVGDAAIQTGAVIPHFRALDEHSQTYDSAALAGTPALIKFFRGHW
jgi:hypothetical protein